MVILFFSSRRRHTRCLSDWSSDVCSSDLIAQLCDDAIEVPARLVEPPFRLGQVGRRGRKFYPAFCTQVFSREGFERSEERRVGKECRFGWFLFYYKKINYYCCQG